jgi:hypothetical protein
LWIKLAPFRFPNIENNINCYVCEFKSLGNYLAYKKIDLICPQMGLALAHEVNINDLQLLHAMLHNNPFANHD